VITAKIIADSIGEYSPRLTTLQLRYPRFIHSEFMTHRVLSRNSSSSRAIPVDRLIADVENDMVTPIVWYKNKPGMQGTDFVSDDDREKLNEVWKNACTTAIGHARQLIRIGAHKQHINRIIEPWCHINTIVTATEWSNFFALRCHPDAQPEMCKLAGAIFRAMANSVPRLLYHGDWHLPFLQNIVAGPLEHDAPEIKVSVARCARVSYLTQEGKPPKIEDDLALYDRLVGSIPLHASPTEHQATPDIWTKSPSGDIGWFEHPELHGNLSGYIQFRKTLPGESQ